MKKITLLLTFIAFNLSSNVFGANLLNTSWRADNSTPGALATYTFNYTIVTPSPNMIIYAAFPTGFDYNGVATVSINGVPANINFANSSTASALNYIYLRLATPSLATANSNIIVTLQVTNRNATGSFNWNYITTANSGGNPIDVFNSPEAIVLGTLSKKDFTNENAFKIFPNPATKNVTINAEEDMIFEIVNQRGQVIKTFETSTIQSFTIDTQNFARGLYYINGRNEKKKISKKLIIE